MEALRDPLTTGGMGSFVPGQHPCLPSHPVSGQQDLGAQQAAWDLENSASPGPTSSTRAVLTATWEGRGPRLSSEPLGGCGPFLQRGWHLMLAKDSHTKAKVQRGSSVAPNWTQTTQPPRASVVHNM